MDTLAFGCILPTTGRIPDFHRLETCAAGRTIRNDSPEPVDHWYRGVVRWIDGLLNKSATHLINPPAFLRKDRLMPFQFRLPVKIPRPVCFAVILQLEGISADK